LILGTLLLLVISVTAFGQSDGVQIEQALVDV